MGTANFTSKSGRYFILFEDNDFESWEVDMFLLDIEEDFDEINSMELQYANGDYINISAELKVRGGYYAGANVDIEWSFEVGNNEKSYDNSTHIEDIEYIVDSETVKHVKRVKNKLYSMKETIEDNIAKLLVPRYCTEIKVLGQFSNGEAVYAKV